MRFLGLKFCCLISVTCGLALANAQHRPGVDTVQLGIDDLVSIKVFQEPELDTVTRVSSEGAIVFPLIGKIDVAGKSVPQAAELLRSRLEERYLNNPQVSLTVVEKARELVTILGQVQRPGTYRLPDGQSLDLLQVIGIAGGYTRLADSSRVIVKRRTEDREQVFKLNAKKMASDKRVEPFEIKPGDLITVGERLF